MNGTAMLNNHNNASQRNQKLAQISLEMALNCVETSDLPIGHKFSFMWDEIRLDNVQRNKLACG